MLPHSIVAPETKFVPLTVRVNSGPPAVTEVGEIPLMVGTAALIVNVAPVDVPPESVTVTLAVPALAIRLAGTEAVNCVALAKDVVSAVLPHCTVAPETKFAPLTVRVNAAPPAVADAGEVLVIVGTATAAFTVNVDPGDVPAELVTVTVAEPGVAIRLAGTTAVSWVTLTYVLANSVAPHCTVVPESKFVPLIVNVNPAPPAVADEGETLEIVGAPSEPLDTVNTAPGDVPAGVVTVTLTEPVVAIRLAGTAAVTCVALTYAVVNPVLPH